MKTETKAWNWNRRELILFKHYREFFHSAHNPETEAWICHHRQTAGEILIAEQTVEHGYESTCQGEEK